MLILTESSVDIALKQIDDLRMEVKLKTNMEFGRGKSGKAEGLSVIIFILMFSFTPTLNILIFRFWLDQGLGGGGSRQN